VPIATRALPMVAAGAVAAPVSVGLIVVGTAAICSIMIVRKLTSSRFSAGYGGFNVEVGPE
jgi:hypothetical protein